MIGRRALLCTMGAVALLLQAVPALAQGAPSGPPAAGNTGERANLLGDMGGLRPVLARAGVTLRLQETSEVLGNVAGGIRTGADYDGVTTMSLGLDTDKAFGWRGGDFFVSALLIHGRDHSADTLANLQTASGIEAERATRLWELWVRQAFLDDKMDVKLGQQSIDQEFTASTYAALYLNTMMGWPMLPSADLYAGGPAYPLSSLGVRVRAEPSAALTLLGGVFDDNPPGGPFADDSQRRGSEASGTRFNLNTGALFIAEIQYADCGTMECGLPGTYRLGAWYDTAAFPDQRFDGAGLSLANPASSGIARLRRGNFSVYGVMDQMVWRQARGPRWIGVFARVMVAPDDRNAIDWSLNAGVNMKAPLPAREDDTVGIGYGLAHVGGRASDRDRDAASFAGTAFPVRGAEHIIEVTYQLQLAPWCQLQPDFQYVIDPGGGIPNPRHPAQRLGDEAVLGLRATITF
jgi:porin